jgi:GNAT superfamily N-acetyltransferase
VTLLPAAALHLPALADLFTDCFSDYAVPMQMDEPALREHLETNGIDLDCSRVVVEERPAAFALIARRGDAGWVGGMGTVGSHRRRGLGTSALTAGIEAARERGCNTVRLEVIDASRAAARLYEKLGFEFQRELVVWSLPATGRVPPPSRPVQPQVTAADEASAAVALLATAARQRDLRLANVPVDEASSGALWSLGARAVLTQREMLLRLKRRRTALVIAKEARHVRDGLESEPPVERHGSLAGVEAGAACAARPGGDRARNAAT